MRTTLTLDDDVYADAMREAESRKLSLGKVISDLARKGACVEVKLQRKRGLVLPELPDDSPVIDMATVRRLESEQ
ncbi:MAG: hypothetical protein ACXW3Z_03880 [Limisphaerales bacterium]